jgi:hypothetical protein
MATQTFDFAHSQNGNVVTRVVLTDISSGVLNYTISLVRLNDSVVAFNRFGSSVGGASIEGITIFGQAVSNRTYIFDWWVRTTQTLRRTNGSAILRDLDTNLFRVGMEHELGPGINVNAKIISVGSTTVTMDIRAFSSGTAETRFGRELQPASVLIATGNLNVTPGTVGSIGGVSNARGTVGSATLSGSFTSYIDGPAWVTTSPLATGTRGVSYSRTVSASRATNYSLVSGSLPAGLSLSSGGVISGTPTTVQSRTFTIRASNTGGISDRAFTISIVVPAPVFSTTSPLPIAIRGSSYSRTISASDTPSTGYSLVSGTPPAGLTLGSNGVLSGTPTTLGVRSFTVRATNTTGSADRSFSLTVNPPAPVFSDQSIVSSAARNIPYQDQVVASDAGYGITSPTTAYSIFSGALPPGLTLNTSTGVIGRTTAPTQAPTTVGTYQFVIRATNVTGSTNTGTLIIVVANNLGKRRTDSGFENITSIRRFDGNNWQPTTIAKRFDATLGWVDISNS